MFKKYWQNRKIRILVYIVAAIILLPLIFDVEHNAQFEVVTTPGGQQVIRPPSAAQPGEMAMPDNPTVWQKLFSFAYKDNNRPEETLVAPFASEGVEAADPKDINNYTVPTPRAPLDQPIASTAGMSEWVTHALSIVLSFNSTNDMTAAERTALFTESALGQYRAYLEQSLIQSTLSSGQYVVSSYVESPPVVRSKGAQEGVYVWIYDTPVVITVRERTASANPRTEQRKAWVRTYVSRVAEGGGAEGVKISAWNVFPRN